MSPGSLPKAEDVLKSGIESFSVASPWLKKSDELRLDASFYNPRVAEALSVLQQSVSIRFQSRPPFRVQS